MVAEKPYNKSLCELDVGSEQDKREVKTKIKCHPYLNAVFFLLDAFQNCNVDKKIQLPEEKCINKKIYNPNNDFGSLLPHIMFCI